ncbi:hypothetical protein [Methylocella sp.]|uniref:hypothetical protein n=1 Tax=Methylocella sp. TaxID=1978226 RepID=UPI00378350A0
MLRDGKTGGNKDETSVFGDDRLAASFDASARPIVTVDVRKYQSYLDESGLSEEKKAEFLQALWSIVVAFVDLGFGVHPLQEVCGQNSEPASQGPKEGFDLLASKGSNNTQIIEESGLTHGLEVE